MFVHFDAFTVMDFVDDVSPSSILGKVTDQDASTNFFLPKKDSINADSDDASSRRRLPTKAEAACKYLQEMNPDVSGSRRNLPLTTQDKIEDVKTEV